MGRITGASIMKIEVIMFVKKPETAKWPGAEKDSFDQTDSRIC
jgi:hypothetical protein